MQDQINIDLAHSRAMRTEIGECLREILARDPLPAQIENPLSRLRELDDDNSPAIVPSIAHNRSVDSSLINVIKR